MRAVARTGSVRTVKRFAIELVEDRRCPPDHAEAWRRVALASGFEDVLVALGYSAGLAEGVLAACASDVSSVQLATALANAAKTFAALLRSPVPLDITPCVDVYEVEVRARLADVAGRDAVRAARTA